MEIRTQIGESGRISLPSRLRKALELQTGDEVVLRLENGTIRLIPLKQAVKMAQTTVRRYIPEGTSLVDDLLKERQVEADSE